MEFEFKIDFGEVLSFDEYSEKHNFEPIKYNIAKYKNYLESQDKKVKDIEIIIEKFDEYKYYREHSIEYKFSNQYEKIHKLESIIDKFKNDIKIYEITKFHVLNIENDIKKNILKERSIYKYISNEEKIKIIERQIKLREHIIYYHYDYFKKFFCLNINEEMMEYNYKDYKGTDNSILINDKIRKHLFDSLDEERNSFTEKCKNKIKENIKNIFELEIKELEEIIKELKKEKILMNN